MSFTGTSDKAENIDLRGAWENSKSLSQHNLVAEASHLTNRLVGAFHCKDPDRHPGSGTNFLLVG